MWDRFYAKTDHREKWEKLHRKDCTIRKLDDSLNFHHRNQLLFLLCDAVHRVIATASRPSNCDIGVSRSQRLEYLKIMSWLISLGCSLSVDPNITDLLQGDHPEIPGGIGVRWITHGIVLLHIRTTVLLSVKSFFTHVSTSNEHVWGTDFTIVGTNVRLHAPRARKPTAGTLRTTGHAKTCYSIIQPTGKCLRRVDWRRHWWRHMNLRRHARDVTIFKVVAFRN